MPVTLSALPHFPPASVATNGRLCVYGSSGPYSPPAVQSPGPVQETANGSDQSPPTPGTSLAELQGGCVAAEAGETATPEAGEAMGSPANPASPASLEGNPLPTSLPSPVSQAPGRT